jgi:hypothetical protein
MGTHTPASEYPKVEFSLREFGGSLGDFGTLLPLVVGYIAINGLNPAGLFLMLGITNIVLGLVYHLPMPVQPKKVIAAVAISQGWAPTLVYASGLGLGLTWLFLVFSGLLHRLVRWTPTYLVRGIQLGLGIALGLQAVRMMAPAPLLGALAIAIIFLLRKSRYAPASVVVIGVGIALVALRGDLENIRFGFTLPPLTPPRPRDVWQAMVLAGFAQIPLTLTNSVMATGTLIRDYFPDKPVGERKLMLTMGFTNLIVSFFSGMPVCTGSGGLAAKYYFGGRTGGASIMEGLIEVAIGLFLSRSIIDIMEAFPLALVGGMLLLVGIQLGSLAFRLRGWPLILAVITAGISVAVNIGVGFVVGLALSVLARELHRRGKLPTLGDPCHNEALDEHSKNTG